VQPHTKEFPKVQSNQLDEFAAKAFARPEEVAELTGVSADTIWRAIREGEFPWPTYRIGRRRIVIPTAPIVAALRGPVEGSEDRR
jgi:excisionase family DNA binding protein